MTFLKNFFFKSSPILKFEIKEESMVPVLSPGDNLLVERVSKLFRNFKVGEIIVFKKRGKFLIKRIQKVKGHEYFVIGDNPEKSKDSRHFGWISKENVIGKVIYQYHTSEV